MIDAIIRFILEHEELLKSLLSLFLFVVIYFVVFKIIKRTRKSVDNAKVMEGDTIRPATKDEKYEIARYIVSKPGRWTFMLFTIGIVLAIAAYLFTVWFLKKPL